jgi:hypothetical protein
LGNGELASLAYGSFKELLQIEELLLREEPRQGGLVARLWPVFGSSSVRLRFVFGASSKAGIGPVCVRDGFRPRLGAGM